MDSTQLQVAYASYRADTAAFEKRSLQSREFRPLAHDILSSLVQKGHVTNEDLTTLIHLFRPNPPHELAEKYLSTLIPYPNQRSAYLARLKALKVGGYTAPGRRKIHSLTDEQLRAVHELLTQAFKVKNAEEAGALCAAYDAKRVPFVTAGVYSPWLHYIKPTLFPILNGPSLPFWKKQGLPTDYPALVKAIPALQEVIGETDLGLVDGLAWCARPSEGQDPTHGEWREQKWLKKISREHWEHFLDACNELIEALELGPDDERLAMNARRDDAKRISVNLRQRLALGLEHKRQTRALALLAPEPAQRYPGVEFTDPYPYKDVPAGGNWSMPIEGFVGNDEAMMSECVAIAKPYSKLGDSSAYRVHHIHDLYRMATEPEFRKAALDHLLESKGEWPGTTTAQMESPRNGITRPRYWAGGFRSTNSYEDLERYKSGNFWQALNYSDEDTGATAAEARRLFGVIKAGDYFLIKGYGGRNDLNVHYVGRVVRKDATTKRLDLSRLDVPLYNGKAPGGSGAGVWYNTLLEVKRPDDIKKLFGAAVAPGTNNENKPLPTLPNIILYGPPGTGKTYALKNKYFEQYTTKPSEVPREQRMYDALQDLTWWEVIGTVLLDIGPSNVDAIRQHELTKAKAAMSNSNNVRATLWSNLQFHTVNECELVKYEKRTEPLIFNKREHSIWEVLDEAIDESYPALRDHLSEYRAGYQKEGDERKEIRRYEFVTFHQAYTYEDFIEGLKPQLESKEIGYEIVPGIFKRLCERAEQDPEHEYALFIDEINRGNIAAIFGELITLIEEDKRIGAANEMRATLPYSKPATFGVPANVRIIGTMNTADRSVEVLDTALRRRFSFEEYPSKPEELNELAYRMVGGVDLGKLLTVINARIEMLLDRDHHIGHSYFLNWKEENKELKLREVFKNNIIPLLQEYFYGDPVKVGLVLGEAFVKRLEKEVGAKIELAAGFRKEVDIEAKARYVFQDVAQVPISAFKDICDGK